jgi:hypothetical protein
LHFFDFAGQRLAQNAGKPATKTEAHPGRNQ